VASAAVAPLARARVGEQACLAANGGLAWSGTLAGNDRVGDTLVVSATLVCSGPGGRRPLVGVPLTFSTAPAGLVQVSGTNPVLTGAGGTAVFHLVVRRPGAGTATVGVADGGACAAAVGASGCRLAFHLALQPAAGLPPAHPGRTYGILPPADPAVNGPAEPSAPAACHSVGPGPAGQYNPSAACAEVFVRLIDAQLVKEHAHPIHLPSNWSRLTTVEQLFVTADLERVARGLPPYVGLSIRLDAIAQAGAVANQDPVPPANGVLGASSNWAGGQVSAAGADYAWVYLDGWAGPGRTLNLDCTTPHGAGCWGHRDNVLGKYTGLECTDCVMGAGAAYSARAGLSPSLTELFVEPDHPGEYPTFFTWAKDVAPYLRG
jgi:hypothetical protein